MSKQIDFSAYETWLKKEKYQKSTVVLSVRTLKAVVASSKKVPPYLIPTVQRYLRFVADTRKNPIGPAFCARMKKQGIEASAKIKKVGKRQKPVMTGKALESFRAQLHKGDDIDKLIAAYLSSGMRAADFLVSSCGAFTSDDTAANTWIRSKTSVAWTAPMFKLVADSQSIAYSRMRTRMRDHGKRMKMRLDLDTLYLSRRELTEDKAA